MEEFASGKALAEKINKKVPASEVVPELIGLLNELQQPPRILAVLLSIKYYPDKNGLHNVFRETGGFDVLVKLLSSNNSEISLLALRFCGDIIAANGKEKTTQI